MADAPAAAGRETVAQDEQETVAGVANLYLGNILYAIERAALAMEAEGKATDAAWYRGVARKLAEARGRERSGG